VTLTATRETMEAMLRATTKAFQQATHTMEQAVLQVLSHRLQLPHLPSWARVEVIPVLCHAHREYRFLFLGWRKATWNKILIAIGARMRG